MNADGNDAAGNAALRVEHFSKTFGTRRVLDDVSFTVAPGSVHALLGGNGCGKSTLVKALSGVQPADVGGRLSAGEASCESPRLTPAWARQHGLRFVHQNPGVIATMTVAENLFINHRLLSNRGWVSRRRLERASTELLARFEIDVDPRETIGELRLADQTMVAIARALRTETGDQDIAALVLDEPTAALPEEEVEILLGAVRRVAAAGASIIYITHRLQEALQLADTVTVLRDGRMVVTETMQGVEERTLVSWIVGRPLDELFPAHRPAPATDRRVALELRGVSGGLLRDVSLKVHCGEIVGIAGLAGSGASELLRAVFGDHPIGAGQVLIGGEPLRSGSPSAAMAAGVAYVPEGRDAQAVFPALSVRDNLMSADIPHHARAGFIDATAERSETSAALTEYGIRAPSAASPMSTLSGGNQQKVILARWMRRAPNVLLLDEPTQGVDIGARSAIYRLVRTAVDGGLAVLLVSSDFEELAELSDRVLTLNQGSIGATVHGAELDEHRLTELVLLTPTPDPRKELIS